MSGYGVRVEFDGSAWGAPHQLIAKVGARPLREDNRAIWLRPDGIVWCSCLRGSLPNTKELVALGSSEACWHIRALFGQKDVWVERTPALPEHLTYPDDFEIDFTEFGQEHFAWRLAARAMAAEPAET